VFFQLAEGAALPHVVARAQLPAALARNQARDQGAQLAGQPLGGLLFGISHLLPFLVDAISYLVGFCSLLLVRSRLQQRRDGPRRHLLAEVAQGIGWSMGRIDQTSKKHHFGFALQPRRTRKCCRISANWLTRPCRC
jgi:hypothetical protein